MSTENPNTYLGSTNPQKVERTNPWLAIWFQTQKALLYVWNHIPEEYIHRFYMFTGLMFMLAVRLPDWLAVTPNPIGVMIQILLVGPVGGIVVGYLYSAFLRFVGKWLGKEMPSMQTKSTVAWTQLPFALFWGLFVLVYFLLNDHQAALHKEYIWLFQDFVGWLPLIVASPLFAWGIVMRIRGIRLLFGFSTARAAAAWIITFVLAYLPASAILVVYAIIYFVTASGG